MCCRTPSLWQPAIESQMLGDVRRERIDRAETERKFCRQTDRQTDTHTHTQTDRRRNESETERERQQKTDGRTDGRTDTHTQTVPVHGIEAAAAAWAPLGETTFIARISSQTLHANTDIYTTCNTQIHTQTAQAALKKVHSSAGTQHWHCWR